MIRLVIADDHPIVRTGLRAVIETEPDVEIVGEAATPSEAIALARQPNIDVVLLDLQFGTELTGVDATQQIRAQSSPPQVLILTNYDSDVDIVSAIEAGASGYLLKDAPPAELIAAIRAAAAGESALTPTIAARVLNRMRSVDQTLSPREIEVLELVAEGKSNAAIARALLLSESTVKSHLVHVFTKLGVSSRTAATAEARARGIIR